VAIDRTKLMNFYKKIICFNFSNLSI